jgi:phage terminase large subunit-like protein
VLQFSLLRTLRNNTDGVLTAKRVFFAGMEITANMFGIEKIRAYTPEQLITKIMAAYRSAKSAHRQIMKEKNNFFKNLIDKIWDKNRIRFNGKAAKKLYLGQVLIDKDNPSINLITTTEHLIANLFIYLILWRRKKIKKDRR